MIPRSLLIATAALLLLVFGLAAYVLHLRSRAQQPLPAAERPVTAPVAAAREKITLHVASDEDRSLKPVEVEVALPAEPQERAREILRALIAQYVTPAARHKLDPKADVADVFLVNDTLAVVNVNEEFAATHASGIMVEKLTLDSFARTVSANLKGVSHIKLIVAGAERETLAGHADLAALYDGRGDQPTKEAQ